MRKATMFIILFCVLALLAATRPEAAVPEKRPPKTDLNPAHPSSFVTRQELHAALAAAAQRPEIPEGRIVSGVVPHHLLAGRLIAEFMEVLAGQEPDLIILVGPNHPNEGGRVITGLYDWQTPEGLVRTDAAVTRDLLNRGLAVRDEETLSREHSVGALVPFIKHFLPQARVVTLILHRDVSGRELDGLAAALEPRLGQKAVLVASVDFSHYLTRREAEAKDEYTLKVMRNFDYATLFRLDNDYLDSPASLALVFRCAEGKGLRQFSVLENTNSGILLQNDVMDTTSYFTLVFTQEQSRQ
jgi:AmmeMemoRadiSam system protein B